MNIEQHLPLVDDILAAYRDRLGDDYAAYRNHVYRVVNLCYAAGPFSVADQAKIQIAGAFHDLGIWTDGTLDYLPPSIREAGNYLMSQGKPDWIAEISGMIEFHHRTRACDDSPYPLVEAFRRADVADFSLGLVRMGFPGSLIAGLKAAFPNAGFHRRLMVLGSRWLVRHPLNPLPMFRR